MNSRIKNYQELKYGLFIHYGLYSLLEDGEWYWEMNKLTQEEYLEKIGDLKKIELNPNFDQIVKNAKEWGFKYIVLTTRHHEGFSLYDTRGLSNFDINRLKNKKDLVREFVDVCKKYGMKPVLYHTTLDWYNEKFKSDFNGYLDYLYKSIEILTKNYGDLAGFWFDGNWSKPEAEWKEEELYSMIRKNQPNAIIANNSGLNAKGSRANDFLEVVTFEQGALIDDLINVKTNVVKEVCETINDHWGFAKEDFNFKSVNKIIYNLVNILANNANYLLNIGLNKKGEVGPMENQIFNYVSKFIDKYGLSLFNEFKLVDKKEGNYLIESKDSYYIFLENIKSGGHVDEIAYGSKEISKISFSNVKCKISEMIGLDDNVKYHFDLKNGVLSFIPKTFKYGNNTIYKVIKCEKELKKWEE